MHIVLVMCFYDRLGRWKKHLKRGVTLLQLKYYKYIKQLLEKKDNVKLDFILVGSEKEKSRQTVIEAGLSPDYYYEFCQENYTSVYKVIQDKYQFGYNTAINKYKDTMDVLLTNGSSDFVPIKFFEELIKNELSNSENIPYYYGISSLKLPSSFIFYIFNNTDNCYFVKDSKMKWNGRIIDFEPAHCNFCGGIYGFTKHLLKKINYKISLKDGNENILEKSLINNFNAVPKPLCNWFLNYKIADQDVTNCYDLKKDLVNIKVYNGKDDEVNNFLYLLKNL